MNEKRELLKKEIKEFIEQNGIPSCAYFYDGCELVFDYYDQNTGLTQLSNKTFNYWEDNMLIGKYAIADEYEKLLKELGLNIGVYSMQDREEGESVDGIEDFLFEYCLGNKELMDKLNKMTIAEKKAWYDELAEEEW